MKYALLFLLSVCGELASLTHVVCCQALRLLRLESIADSLVGDSDYTGLSPSQAKRLTIGIELVANPSILLVDGMCVCHCRMTAAALCSF